MKLLSAFHPEESWFLATIEDYSLCSLPFLTTDFLPGLLPDFPKTFHDVNELFRPLPNNYNIR